MACNRVGNRVVNYILSYFLFLFIPSALHTTPSFNEGFNLFSLSHDDQNGLKININCRTIYNEEALKKEIEDAEFHKKAVEQYPQEIKEIKDKKENIKRNIEIKKAILQKKFMESNVK